MTSVRAEMLSVLTNLKQKYYLNGVKFSFEDEGLTREFAQVIASICDMANVNTTLKIGGCEAKNDIREARLLGVNKIVAPMIESPYALKKFISAAKEIIPNDELEDIDLCINIETITGYDNLEKMLNQEDAKDLKTIVFGRSDFVGSLEKDKSFVNSEEMLEYAQGLAQICRKYDKKIYIGGNVTAQSITFFKELPIEVIGGIETRNIIFDSSIIEADNVEAAIQEAMKFEFLWLEYKTMFHNPEIDGDKKRINALKQRLS